MKKKYFTEEERKAADCKKSKEYVKRNKEKVAAKQKTYRSLAKDKTAAYRNTRRKTKAGYLDRLVEVSKTREPTTGINRDYLETIFGDTCALTGVSFEYDYSGGGSYNPLAPSLDRIDSNKGYFKDNVQVVAQSVNRWKNDTPNEEFKQVMKTIFKSWKALTNG
jgi:hypothetical protein